MDEDKKGIAYSKKALEEINRPVLVDDVFQVISPKNWIFLLVLFFILLVFVIWLFKGQLFITVQGHGLLMSATNDMVTVQTQFEESHVKAIYVNPGDKIEKNTVLFRLDNPLQFQLKAAQLYLNGLKKEQKDLSVRAKDIISNLEKNQNEQVEKITQSREAALQKLNQLEVLQKLKESAFKRRIIDLPNLTETRVEYYRLLQEVRSHEADLISMRANMIDLRNKWLERQRDFALSVLKQESEVALLQSRLNESSLIRSPVSGVVAEIRVRPGDHTKPGDVLLTIVPNNQMLYALVFVPVKKGKLVKPHLLAQLFPTLFNKLEYGGIKGEVQTVSNLSASPEYIMSLVKNTKLVEYFLSNQPVMAIKIMLKKNASNHSGYEWTSRHGPDFQLTQGTLLDASINIKVKRPIDLLVNFYQ